VTSDLVHATAEVVGGSITFVVQLAAGTLDRQSTRSRFAGAIALAAFIMILFYRFIAAG
jgi:hypothetical protein